MYTFRFIRHFERDDRARLYEQIRRVLRSGGHLVFDAVNAVVSRPLREQAEGGYKIYDVLYESEVELRAELSEEGLKPVRIEPVQRNFPLQHRIQTWVGPRSRWLSRTLIEGIEKVSRGPSLEWIVTCRRE